MKTVYTLAIEACHGKSLFVQQDLYTLANKLWSRTTGKDSYFQLKTLSRSGTAVTTTSGLRILPDGPLEDVAPESLIVIPTVNYESRQAISKQLTGLGKEITWLQNQHQRGAILTAHCTGSFILGETGLLEALPATTSWWLLEAFRRRYPSIRVKRRNLVERGSDQLITGGSANADTLIALQLIEHYMGPVVADQCARTLLIDRNDNRHLPGISLQRYQDHDNTLVAKAQSLIHNSFDQALSLGEVAEQLGVSTRTLIRHFKDTLGLTPRRYLQRIRVETAASLLETTDLNATEVMVHVGYEDPGSFTKLFRDILGTTPAQYLQRKRRANVSN